MFEKIPAYVPPPNEMKSVDPSRRSKLTSVQVFDATTTDETTDAPGLLVGVAKRPVSVVASVRLWRNQNETPVTPAEIQLPTYAPFDEPKLDWARITVGGKPPTEVALRLNTLVTYAAPSGPPDAVQPSTDAPFELRQFCAPDAKVS